MEERKQMQKRSRSEGVTKRKDEKRNRGCKRKRKVQWKNEVELEKVNKRGYTAVNK